jgi:hypothetical protein
MELDILRDTSNHWSPRNCIKEVSGNKIREPFTEFSTRNNCASDIAHNKESAAV